GRATRWNCRRSNRVATVRAPPTPAPTSSATASNATDRRSRRRRVAPSGPRVAPPGARVAPSGPRVAPPGTRVAGSCSAGPGRQCAAALEPAAFAGERIDELEDLRQQLQRITEVVQRRLVGDGVERVADDRHAQRGEMDPELVRAARGGHQPVAAESVAVLEEFDVGL